MRRIMAPGIVVTVMVLPLSACGGDGDDTALRQLPPGRTAYIKMLNPDADKGKRAAIRLKGGLWVIPENAHYRVIQSGDFKLPVSLLKEGRFALGYFQNGTFVPWTGGFQYGKSTVHCISRDQQYLAVWPQVSAPTLEAQPTKDELEEQEEDEGTPCLPGG